MDFRTVADDYFINVDLQTTLDLPQSRETVLHLFEAARKRFPAMTNLYQRDSGEFVLEGDREAGSYQWLELQPRRLSAGSFNPANTDEACRLHRWLLEGSVYFLGVGTLDVEALDVMFGFNMDYKGNRDAILAEALLGSSPLGMLGADLSGRVIECEPAMVVTLDEECRTQARLSLETRGNSFQVRTGQYDDEPISVYFAVRGYPGPGRPLDLAEAFGRQFEICRDLICRSVIPNVVNPIAAAIATAQ